MSNVVVGRHIVIVGAGYGGVVAASFLAKKGKRYDDLHITLVNPREYQDSRSELDLVVARNVDTDFCNISLPELYKDTNVELVFGRMRDLDQENNTITILPTNKEDGTVLEDAEPQELYYDELVIGVGARPAFPPVPGLEKYATPLWSVVDVEKYKKKALSRFEAASQAETPEERKKLLTFTIVGAGATGVEIAAPFAQSTRSVADEYNVPFEDITVNLVDGLDEILADLDADQQAQARERIEELGIELILGSFVKEVEEETIHLQNGTSVHGGLIIFAGGAKVDDVVGTWGLPTLKNGRIIVDKTLRVQNTRNIWALGDAAAVPFKDKPELPMLAQHAMRQGEIIAHNTLSSLYGSGHLKKYEGTSHGQFVSIGNGYAIGWAGMKGVKLRGKLGAMMKRLTYQLYWHKAGGLDLLAKRSAESRNLHK